MLIKLILLIICIFNFCIKSSISQDIDGANNLLSIVAIVNDEPITMMDLDAGYV